MAYKSEKQREFIYRNSFNYAKEKGAAKSFFTSTFKNGNKEILYNDIREAWKQLREYKQVSTGLNHYRRDVFVIDSDYENPIDYDEKIFGENGLLPKYSYRIINKETGHCQYGYFLDDAILPDSEEFKKLKQNIPLLINYYFGKKILQTMRSEEFADPKFTQWQCKNCFYEKFSVDGDFEKTSVTSIKLGMQKLSIICDDIEINENRQISKKEYIKANTEPKGRYDYFTKLYRKALLDKINELGRAELSTEILKTLTSECRKKSAELCGKELEDKGAVLSQAKAIYEWVIKNGFTDSKRKISEHRQKLKRLAKIMLIKETLEEIIGKAIKDDTLENAYKSLNNSQKKMLREKTKQSTQNINLLIKCSIKEYKENANDYYYKMTNIEKLNENYKKDLNIIEKIKETQEETSYTHYYTDFIISEKLEENAEINTTKEQNDETLQRINKQNEEFFFIEQIK